MSRRIQSTSSPGATAEGAGTSLRATTSTGRSTPAVSTAVPAPTH
ncbi:hypothetical protein AB0939_03300 [Streptomyces sp. NPDC006990]